MDVIAFLGYLDLPTRVRYSSPPHDRAGSRSSHSDSVCSQLTRLGRRGIRVLAFRAGTATRRRARTRTPAQVARKPGKAASERRSVPRFRRNTAAKMTIRFVRA
jgi:hypothetical protein